MTNVRELLPHDALRGRRIGVSISDSPDLGRLGLLTSHLRLALGEIARAVLVAGGSLAYGGHLEPTGFTPFLAQELERYGAAEGRLLVCLGWPVHREVALSELDRREEALGLVARVVYLDPHGEEIPKETDRGEAPEPTTDPVAMADGLTAMRRYLTAHVDARVLLGGRRSGAAGRYPGLLEEALLALESGQPLFLAGGFGGVTADIADALGVGLEWLPPAGDAPPADGLPLIREFRDAEEPWRALANGLDGAENARLAASHRPSDVAALVTLGLGRVAALDGDGGI
ncbi:hypothetical protein AB0M46_47370 [Dactylosporangium sp. NPDC051485]|uniref:hypothetical protein n=1 Tax=Dactylosporangium sp. NPDC051485 TaxID=3154846 RepID=UPI00342A93D3